MTQRVPSGDLTAVEHAMLDERDHARKLIGIVLYDVQRWGMLDDGALADHLTTYLLDEAPEYLPPDVTDDGPLLTEWRQLVDPDGRWTS